jgi:hypothetical protein
MGPTPKLSEDLEIVISFETFPITHGGFICAGLTVAICFFSGSLDLPIAAHNAVFLFLSFIVVEEVRRYI